MGCISKCGLLFINCLVVAAGLCVVGVSAAILRQQTIFGVLLTQVFYTVPLSALIGGLFLTFLGVWGCVGAARESSCMLKTYAVIVGLLLVGVVAVGVTLLVFTLGSANFLVESMTDIFNQYNDNSSLSHDLDVMQHTIQCCGIYAYTDWEDFTYGNKENVADGCCRNQTEGCGVGILHDPDVTDLIYTRGCLVFVTNAFNTLSLGLGLLTLFLASMQLLSIIWACILARDSSRYRAV